MLVVSAFLLILGCVTLTIAGVWSLRFPAASAQTPAPQRQAGPPSLDTLNARERELEALRAEQRRTLENEARLKRGIAMIAQGYALPREPSPREVFDPAFLPAQPDRMLQ